MTDARQPGEGTRRGCKCRAWIRAAAKWFHKYHASIGVAITIVVGLAGGTYALVQYIMKQEEIRVARTLEYVTRIQTGAVSEWKRNYDMFLIGNIDLIREAQTTMDGARFDAIYSELETRYLQQAHGQKAVIGLSYFYSDVATCVNWDLCDVRNACIYFAEDIRSFRGLFKAFLDRWEEAWAAGVGREMETLLSACDALSRRKN